MKFKISIPYYWLKIQIELNGKGTVDEPFLISNIKDPYSNESSRNWFISDNSSYIKFNKILVGSLSLTNCKNVTIANSKLRKIILSSCSNILIHNVQIERKLKIEKVKRVKFVDCKIHRLLSYSGDQIVISGCFIHSISKKNECSIQLDNTTISRISKKNRKNFPGIESSVK